MNTVVTSLRISKLNSIPFIFFSLFLLTFIPGALGQTAATLDPDFNAADPGLVGAQREIYVSTVQADGKILIGGRFTYYQSEALGGIARLNADGTVDHTFSTGSGFGYEHLYDLVVVDIVVQPDGKILVAGDFVSFNGSAAHGLIRLNADGSRDNSFSSENSFFIDPLGMPRFMPVVHTVLRQADGKLVVGGNFTAKNATSSKNLVRLNADGSVDNTFSIGTGVDILVNALMQRPDGEIFVGGFIEQFNGAAAYDMVLLNLNGSRDLSFDTNLGFNGRVNDFELLADGKIVVCGDFSTYNGVKRIAVARLNGDGTLDTDFDAGELSATALSTVLVHPDGRIFVGGSFNSLKGKEYHSLVALTANGAVDPNFKDGLGASALVTNLALAPDNKILATGGFTSYNGVTRERIARVHADGSLDESFNTNDTYHFDDQVTAVAVQSDGKIIAGGDFTSYLGKARNKIVRINEDGSLDETFAVGKGFNYSFNDLIIQPDNKILVAGQFWAYQGEQHQRLIRLNPDGGVDNTLAAGTGFDGGVFSMALQNDGKILVGGYFSNYNGVPREKIARLLPGGILDPTFDATLAFDQEIEVLAVQGDGKILAGGSFTKVNGNGANHIVRLNADGTVDNTFLKGSGVTDRVFALAVQPDGKILAGGTFSSYNGTAVSNIVRLNSDGTIDNTFNSGSGFDLGVYKIVLQPDDKILVGGYFTKYNGNTHKNIVRLNADGTVDATFDAGTGFDGAVNAIAIHPNGTLAIGGYFYTYNGAPRSHLASIYSGLKTSQTITFDPLPDKTYGEVAFEIQATATSNLPVSFSSSNLAVATVSGSQITVVGTGTTTIMASQAGNESFAAAKAVQQTLTVQKATQVITFGPLEERDTDSPQFDLMASASSGLVVTFSSSHPDVASVDGNTVTIYNSGETMIRATQEGNANYMPAMPVEQALVVKLITATEQLTSEQPTVYPNPSTGYYYVKISPTGCSVNCELFNAMGQRQSVTAEYSGENFVLNLTDKPKGVYTLKLKDCRQISQVKLVKE
ncbi:delta-60 repeat domain-containing protein/Por secretion system C-terminal sorting domain-containing protein [Chryseolinea serpens]|uniref:Delta-60 repeat domain-containing protein/Por secretion system C-terminal sorting domain-containing protein n=1 Tax=Chryseolinea serpens TaxID=947013 RepID=A0A1M5R649_9BACT|nr:T9SS type A sorting domain-containing protein [Chryseolinea serpens]SHH21439.1 delta-60 repeat domain-containing protein/Por secretion system C-terminal sorting domain-containing protein [Chryseolinea serpens]